MTDDIKTMVKHARAAVSKNEETPNLETFISALMHVASLDACIFAKYPKLRSVCLAKILQFRNHAKATEDVKDALETLRISLWQSLECEPWTKDEWDDAFQRAVSNHELVYSFTSEDFCADRVMQQIQEETDSDSSGQNEEEEEEED